MDIATTKTRMFDSVREHFDDAIVIVAIVKTNFKEFTKFKTCSGLTAS